MLLSLFFAVLLSAGPQSDSGSTVGPELSLDECFRLATTYNASLRRTAAAVEVARAQDIVSRSRLLPHLSIFSQGNASGWDSTRSESGTGLALRQRVLEFGPTKQAELDRLRSRQHTFQSHEDELVRILSSIREGYFTLKIINRQLAVHDSLLLLYDEKLAQAQSRLETGIGVKSAVLTARLNRLEEQERIVALRALRHQQRAALESLIGTRLSGDSLDMTSENHPIALTEDSCVVLVLRSNSEFELSRYETEIARRALREAGWQWAPQARLSAGVHEKGSSAFIQAGTNPENATRSWAVDMVGVQELIRPDSSLEYQFIGSLMRSPHPQDRFTLSLFLEFPLFRGLGSWGNRAQAGAHYNQARASLIEKTRELEQRVRFAYQEYTRALEQLSIQAERVEIARERYALAETQYERSRIDEYGFDSFREQLFRAQDRFFDQQFAALRAEEHLRRLIRSMD